MNKKILDKTGLDLKARILDLPMLLYGITLMIAGLGVYTMGVLMSIPRSLFGLNVYILEFNEAVVWYSGLPVFLGMLFAFVDLVIQLPHKRVDHLEVMMSPPRERMLTVVLTAYNDEQSIALAVNDFKDHPLVKRVIVVSNNSTDNTMAEAESAGAIALNEPTPGYGSCVHRCLSEGIKYEDTELTLLCEGDMTFRSYDIDKFMAYIPHASIVNGTRIVEQLREYNTQLSTFMYYGNFFVGKLLEFKYIGQGTFTDVGTTYKLCRNDELKRLLPHLNSSINLEFNAYFLDTALKHRAAVVECPVTFHARVGESKGGNVNNMRAFKVGMRMMRGLYFGWPGKKA